MKRLLCVFIAVLAVAWYCCQRGVEAAQAPALVQSAIKDGSSDGASHASQTTAAFGSSTITGNLIVVYVGWTGATTLTGCSDLYGNTYAIAAQEVSTATINAGVCYAQGITGSASDTVTASLSSTGGAYFSVYAEEWSAMRPAAIDQTAVTTFTAGTSASENLKTTYPNELMVEVNYLTGSSGTYTAGSGWTIGTQILGTQWKLAGAATAANTCNITWGTSQSGAMVCASFIPRPINAMPVTR